MRFVFALLPFVLSAVVASDHKQCDCQVKVGNDWHYDWQLTFNVCQDFFSKQASYDAGAGRCISDPNTRIDGDRWFHDCQFAATNGYYPIVDGAIDTTQKKLFGTGGSGCYN